MNKPQRILIVDDEVKIAEVIRSYLEKSGYEVYDAQTCAQARGILKTAGADLMILDLMLPDMSGEAFCREVRRDSQIPILMLTAKVAEAEILQGLEIGADDYVTKPFSVRQLVARVQALLRRSRITQEPQTAVLSFCGGELEMEPEKYEVRRSGAPVSLTPNEFRLLLALAANPHRVFTREDLIRAAFGNDFDGYDRTVDSHIKNLRQKIETDPKTPRYILTVFGVGYRFGGEPS